jgi:homocysteine S-methyltransferase
MQTTASRAAGFLDALCRRNLVCDGAMGTQLYARGAFINRCFDELNLSAPGLIREIHQDYVKSGAEILETNTFGANRKRLSAFGLGEKVSAINEAAVRLARDAAGTEAFVAGAVGPLGCWLEPLGPMSFAEARAIFREQIDVLLESGVDLLMLETFTEIHELREAVFAAREAAGSGFPIIAHVSIEDDGSLRDGTSTERFTELLNEWPVDAIGLNCSSGPRIMLETIEKMLAWTDKPLSVLPNAGMPTVVEGRNLYLSSPEYMAQYARRFLQAGVHLVGGCCGTTPAHIREIVKEVRSLQHSRKPARETAAVVEPARHAKALDNAMDKVALAAKSRLGAKLAAGQFVVFAEILPPRGVDASKEIAGAKLCQAAGFDCINVPDGPRASARLSAQITCQLIQQHAGIEAVLHFCCRDRNTLSIQSELLGAHAAGVRNLLCITGDPPRMGSYPDATAVFDVDSIGLTNIVNNLNQGLDLGGSPMGSQTALVIGVGANPGAFNPDEELRRLDWKAQAGAEYIVTQPVFDPEMLHTFLARIAHLKLPVIAGIWPLTSYRNAEFMVNELRVPVPEPYMERMRRAENAAAAQAEGVAIAREMVSQVRNLVAGVAISAPFGRYQLAVDIAEAVGSR